MHTYTLGHVSLESSSAEKDVVVQQVDHELAMCPCNKDGRVNLDWIRKSVASKAKGGDPPPLLSVGGTHLECQVPSWAPQYKTDMEILQKIQQKVKDD